MLFRSVHSRDFTFVCSILLNLIVFKGNWPFMPKNTPTEINLITFCFKSEHYSNEQKQKVMRHIYDQPHKSIINHTLKYVRPSPYHKDFCMALAKKLTRMKKYCSIYKGDT